jgi:PAS domain S-box-containing protein
MDNASGSDPLRLELEQCRRDLADCQARLAQMQALLAGGPDAAGAALDGPAGHADSMPALLDTLSRLTRENERLKEDFRDLFEEAPIPYVHEGLDSRFIRINRAAMNILGIGPDEVEGTFGRDFAVDTPEVQQRLSDAFGSIGGGNETGGVVLELRRKDNGKPVWVQWWSRPAPGGNYTRTMVVDITDRVLAERAREALEFTLKAGHVGDWDLDLIHDTSRRSLRHDQCFGYAEPIAEAEWGAQRFLAHVLAEDRDRVAAGFRAAIDKLENWEAEFRVVWPDGSVHWLEGRGSVYDLRDGKAARMLGIVLDITERKRAEETLRATQAELQFTLQAARLGDWDLDLLHDTSRRSLRHDQCFGYAQPVAEVDWGIEEFIRHVHPQDRERVEAGMRHAIGELRDWSAEFRVVWPDGSLHWLATRGSIYRTLEGRATRMLGIVMEITDSKNAEQAIRASEQLARGQVEALERTTDALAMESSPDRLAEHVLRTITLQLGAHSTSVWLRDEATGMLRFEFAFEGNRLVSMFDAPLARLSPWLPMDKQWPWQDMFSTAQPALIEDIRALPPFALKDRLVDLGIVSVLLVPMSISGKVGGAIAVRFSHRRVPGAEEIQLAQMLANQAMLAMQLTRLSAQSRESAVISERNRMARDIHDTLAQGFTGVIVQLQAAGDARSRGLAGEADEHIARAGDLARESLNEARRSVQALRPKVLEGKHLHEALDFMFKSMTAGTPTHARFAVRGRPRPFPPVWEENLLRVGQEVLTNVLRHARAGEFTALIGFDAGQVRIEMRDNGAGFDPQGRHDGFGLQGIRERVASMGGELRIHSSVRAGDGQGGTEIVILLALPEDP